MTTLIKIRLLQLKFELKHLGILFSILLAAFFIAFEVSVYICFKKFPACVSMSVISIFLFYHFTRKDASFIKLHIEKPKTSIFLEYSAFILLLFTPALFTTHWYFIFIILIGIFITSQVDLKLIGISNSGKFLSKIIPVTYFEALSSLRSSYKFVIVPIIYLAAWCFYSVRGLPLFLLFLLTNLIMSFFAENEPLDILRSNTTGNSKFFLQNKLVRYLFPIIISYTPILILNSISHPDLYLLNFGFLIIQLLSVSAVIFYKYTVYKPNGYFNNFTNPVLIFVGLSAIVPYLIPIILFLNVQYYAKAVKNLNIYLQ